MHHTYLNTLHVDHAVIAIKRGRELAKRLRAAGLSHLDTPSNVVGLEMLERGEAFRPEVETCLMAIRPTLQHERDAEIQDCVNVYLGVCDPEGSDCGAVQERLVLSDHGAELDDLLADLEAFLNARSVVIDRVIARTVLTVSSRTGR